MQGKFLCSENSDCNACLAQFGRLTQQMMCNLADHTETQYFSDSVNFLTLKKIAILFDKILNIQQGQTADDLRGCLLQLVIIEAKKEWEK